jgi:hypothetical protein
LNQTYRDEYECDFKLTELWKSVVLDGKAWPYEVSNYGRVRNSKGNDLRQQKRGKRKGTYFYVTLCDKGRQRRIDTHRLVATMYIPNPNNMPEVNHLNCDPFDPRSTNLEWTDRAGNEKRHRGNIHSRSYGSLGIATCISS